jgi:hypothetical protein
METPTGVRVRTAGREEIVEHVYECARIRFECACIGFEFARIGFEFARIGFVKLERRLEGAVHAAGRADGRLDCASSAFADPVHGSASRERLSARLEHGRARACNAFAGPELGLEGAGKESGGAAHALGPAGVESARRGNPFGVPGVNFGSTHLQAQRDKTGPELDGIETSRPLLAAETGVVQVSIMI